MGILGGLLGPALTTATQAAGTYQDARTKANQDSVATALQNMQLERQAQQDQLKQTIAQQQADRQAKLDAVTMQLKGLQGKKIQNELDNPQESYSTVTGADAKGNPVIYRINKRTGQVEPTGVAGYRAPVQPGYTFVQTVDADGNPIFAAGNTKTGVITPTGVQAKPAAGGKPTEIATRASLVYPRAAEAAKQLDKFYTSGAPAKSKASGIPIIGNYLLSDDEQSMNQAAETVASAILRLESGAAISESEVKSYAKQFLPQPGDGPEVLAQKRATLQTQLARMAAVASPAMGGGGSPSVPVARGVNNSALSDADYWESLVDQGMSPTAATAKVNARSGSR